MISYFFEDTKFKFNIRRVNNLWIKQVAESENKNISNVNIIFCSDNYILDINRRYLQHDYFTDIITFDYCEGDSLSGDLFISVDTVKDNATFYKTDFADELNRVIVHGVLHLVGYDDHSEEQICTMRSKEDYYLDIRTKLL